MSALAFLGGLAGGYTNIRRGIDEDTARTNAEEDRAEAKRLAEEERQYRNSQREYQAGQQQRLVGEQQRADQLRSDLSAVSPTEEFDANKANPVTSQITVDNDGNPSATQIPAMQTRARPQDAQLRDVASAYRKAGDIGKSMELDSAAERAMFDRSAKMYSRWEAGLGGQDLKTAARSIVDIYNNDSLPGQVRKMTPNADGSVTFDIVNKDTGQTHSKTFGTKEEMVEVLRSYYSPQSYEAIQQARAQARAKAEAARAEELGKVKSVRPGEQLKIFDPATGMYRTAGEGAVPAGHEAFTNPDGTTGIRRLSTKEAKPEDPYKGVTDAMKFIADNADFKTTATPVQVAQAQTLARQFFKESGGSMDGSIAAQAAMDAALNPDKLEVKFDPSTGQVVSSYPFRGSNLIVERLGDPRSARGVQPERMKQIASDFLSQQPVEMRPMLIAAAAGKDGVDALRTEVSRRLSTPEGVASLARQIGRQPEESDIDTAIGAAMSALSPQIALLEAHLDPKIKRMASRNGAPAADGMGSFVGSLNDRMLTRISQIPGHANQQAAIEELARRKGSKNAPAELPADTAGMLNISP